jgi:hypothetical protein
MHIHEHTKDPAVSQLKLFFFGTRIVGSKLYPKSVWAFVSQMLLREPSFTHLHLLGFGPLV